MPPRSPKTRKRPTSSRTALRRSSRQHLSHRREYEQLQEATRSTMAVTPYTAGFKTVKTLWNSVLATIKARLMTIDIKDFYLISMTRLESPEYAWVLLAQIPPATLAKYHVEDLVVNGKMLVEITMVYHNPASLLRKISSNCWRPTATT
jgi:hypothetical protein